MSEIIKFYDVYPCKLCHGRPEWNRITSNYFTVRCGSQNCENHSLSKTVYGSGIENIISRWNELLADVELLPISCLEITEEKDNVKIQIESR